MGKIALDYSTLLLFKDFTILRKYSNTISKTGILYNFFVIWYFGIWNLDFGI